MTRGPANQHIEGQRTLWDRFARPSTRTQITHPTTIQTTATHNTPTSDSTTPPQAPTRRGPNRSRTSGSNTTTGRVSPRRQQRTRRPSHRPHTLRQTTVDGSVAALDNGEDWGDSFRRPKPKNTLRLIGGNINGLPTSSFDKGGKMTDFCQTITKLQADVIALTETNIDSRKLPQEDNWYNRVRKHKLNRLRTSWAHNRTGEPSTGIQQYGGTMVLSQGEMTSRVPRLRPQDTSDPLKLGRWTSLTFTGKGAHVLRVVSAYMPCGKDPRGKDTVYHQQQLFLRQQEEPREPRTALLQDLHQALTRWIQAGEKVVVFMDANEDIRSGPVNTMFQSLNMKEHMQSRHPNTPMPSTYIRNTQFKPIDGCWSNLNDHDLKCGYLAYHAPFPGDHRLMVLEIPKTVALGYNPPDLNKKKLPDLTSSDPRSIKRYNKILRKLSVREGVPTLVRQLRQAVSRGDRQEALQLHDQLTKIRRQLGNQAAKQSRKKRAGAIPFSLKMNKLRQTRQLWQRVLLKRRCPQMGTRQIRRLMRKLRIRDALRRSLPTSTIIRNLKQAWQEVAKGKKEADQWRRNDLLSQAQAMAAQNSTTAETEIKNRIAREKTRREWRRIGMVRHSKLRSAVIKVYQSHDGPRTECVTKQDIERACLRENETRFTRCLNSPFTQPPLLQDIGLVGDGPAVPAILQGTYQAPPEADPYAALLLQQLQQDPATALHQPALRPIEAKSHAKGWQRQKAKTAAEPSELSFPHYIVGSHDPAVAEWDAALRSAAYELGLAPEGYKTLTDYQILKSAGVYDVELQRTIKLFPAPFNMNNKLLAKDMMQTAEKAGTLTPFQWGSRKKKSAINVATSKVLHFDIIRQKRLAASHICLDASQCYDRMVHSISALCMIRHGAHAPAVYSMFRTLQEASNHVATPYGVSKASYGGQARINQGLLPIAGIGQGNGAGPAAFAVLSTELVRTLEAQGHTSTITSVLSLTSLLLVCWLFVDDNDLPKVAPTTSTPGEDMIPATQASMDCWVGTLMATGGAINLLPTKTFWYLIDFKWNGQNWVYRMKDDMAGDITSLDATRTRVLVGRKEVTEAAKTMGVMVAPDGSAEGQREYLLKKAEGFAEEIKSSSSITRNDVWIMYKRTIGATLDYPLRATTLDRDDWNSIMKVINKAALPRAGFVSTFSHLILYSPTSRQGGGKPEPWHWQELHHLLDLVEQINAQNSLGSQYQITMEQLRFELGHPGHITDVAPDTMSKCATKSLVKSLWSFCYQYNIGLKDTFPQLQLSREEDEFIMPLFVKGGFTPEELKVLNECRMFLHAITLADITVADGRTLHPQSYEGVRRESRLHEYDWPRQPPMLSTTHWNLWKRALHETILVWYATSTNLRLQQPLGRFLKPPPRCWRWFYRVSTDTVYEDTTDGDTVKVYTRSNRTRRGRFSHTQTLTTRPTTAVPASIQRRGVITVDLLCYYNTPPHRNFDMEHHAPTTLISARGQLNPLDKWAVSHLQCPDNGEAIAHLLTTDQAIAVSDGSYDPMTHQSSSTFIITTRQPTVTYLQTSIKGANRVPGPKKAQNSYRAELGGMMGIITTLSLLCKTHHITQGSLEIGLDGESALEKVFQDEDPVPQDPSYDLILELRRKISLLPITIRGKHVEGHQDNPKHGPRRPIDWWGRLNIAMDEAAKAHLAHTSHLQCTSQPFGQTIISVTHQGEYLTSIRPSALYEHIWGEALIDYWVRRHRIPLHLRDQVSWDTAGSAFQLLPWGKQRWLLKHMAGQCAVGRALSRRGHQSHDHCPLCDAEDEQAVHIVLCPDERARQCLTDALQQFQAWLVKEHTQPDLATQIIYHLTRWAHQELPPPLQGTPQIQRAIHAQAAIGWENFLYGRFPHKLLQAQDRHFKSRGNSRRTGKAWAVRMAIQAHDILWQMWDHRNSIVHGTGSRQDLSRLHTLRTRVQTEFALGSQGLAPADRGLLASQDTVMAYGLQDLRDWLHKIELAREIPTYAQAANHDPQRQSRELMEAWCAYQPPDTPPNQQ